MNNIVSISACLLGEACRYNGSNNKNEILIKLLEEQGVRFFAICPEVLGGLPTPRLAAWIVNGDGNDILSGKSAVIDEQGHDVTNNFIRGANKAVKLSLSKGIKKAVFKERSPSCGVNFIYNNNKIVKGSGVTAALFKKNGIDVKSDEDIIKYDSKNILTGTKKEDF